MTLALVLAASTAFAARPSDELGDFTSSGPLASTGCAVKYAVKGSPSICPDGVSVSVNTATRVVMEKENDLSIEVQGRDLVVERGEYANGDAGLRISGTVTGVQGTRFNSRGDTESVASFAPSSGSTGTDIQIDIVATGIVIDIVATGIVTHRAAFDRDGLVLGVLVNNENITMLKDQGGVTRFTGRNGDAQLSGGTTWVDAFGSSSISGGPGDLPIINLTGPDEVGGGDWEIVSPRDPAAVSITGDAGGDWTLGLELVEAQIDTVVIAGETMRYAEYEE